MNRKFSIYIALAGLACLLFTSCIKDDVTDTTDQGSTFIKILEAPTKNFYYLPFTDIKTVDLFSLRKDPNTNAELNQATTVKVTITPSLITTYNTAHSETYELLPDSLFTTTTPRSGNVYDMSLAAGQFAREFTIKLNGAKWDISHKYALPLVLSDINGKKAAYGRDTLLAFISVKNKWDGTYQAVGVFHHPTAGDRAIDREKALITAGPDAVRAELGDLGGSGYYMIIKINPDNTVTLTPSGVTPNVDQSYATQYYDPVNKSFHLHYSYNTSAPRIVEEVIKLK